MRPYLRESRKPHETNTFCGSPKTQKYCFKARHIPKTHIHHKKGHHTTYKWVSRRSLPKTPKGTWDWVPELPFALSPPGEKQKKTEICPVVIDSLLTPEREITRIHWVPGPKTRRPAGSWSLLEPPGIRICISSAGFPFKTRGNDFRKIFISLRHQQGKSPPFSQWPREGLASRPEDALGPAVLVPTTQRQKSDSSSTEATESLRRTGHRHRASAASSFTEGSSKREHPGKGTVPGRLPRGLPGNPPQQKNRK